MSCSHEEAQLITAECGYITIECGCSLPLAEFTMFCECAKYFPDRVITFKDITEAEAWALLRRLQREEARV